MRKKFILYASPTCRMRSDFTVGDGVSDTDPEIREEGVPSL